MEYLVTMTTLVPEGTPDEAVDEIRAARPAPLASSPRKVTCFASGAHRCNLANGARSGSSPRTMPRSSRKCSPRCRCRVWRSDEVTPLSPHPNDPKPARTGGKGVEFMVRLEITAPEGTTVETVEQLKQREAARVGELRGARARRAICCGARRPSPVSGARWACGVREPTRPRCKRSWSRCPLYDWFTVDITPLSPHPNDPPRYRHELTPCMFSSELMAPSSR